MVTETTFCDAACSPQQRRRARARCEPSTRLRRSGCTIALSMVLAHAGCRSELAAGEPPAQQPADPRARIAIDLLALDLTTCGRCTRTEANLDAAIAAVAERLRAQGREVEVRKTVVRTAEDAARVRLLTSPTIRVGGEDIAIELRESDCSDCGELCGSTPCRVDCRVWVFEGREYTEAPQRMIEQAILDAAARDGRASRRQDREPYRMPENLRAFFAASATTPAAPAPAAGANTACCAPGSSCCSAEQRKTCCTSAAGGDCGCRK